MIDIKLLFITFLFVRLYYKKYDISYNCSNLVHICGLILPLLFIHNLNQKVYYLTLVLSYCMFNFHLCYELYNRNLL